MGIHSNIEHENPKIKQYLGINNIKVGTLLTFWK